MKITKNLLLEMSIERGAAIDKCNHLGKQFISHFHKVYTESDNNTKKHHAMEMQAWLNDISQIKLKTTNKYLNEKNIYDWFITCNQTVSDLFADEEEAFMYDDFSSYLLDVNDRNVLDTLIMMNLIEED